MYQIRITEFADPEQTEGQHTNGPPNVFLRIDNGPWLLADGFRSINKVESVIKKIGLAEFVKQHCHLVKESK